MSLKYQTGIIFNNERTYHRLYFARYGELHRTSGPAFIAAQHDVWYFEYDLLKEEWNNESKIPDKNSNQIWASY